MPTEDKSSYYLWFDTEFTSLELDEAQLLQVALMVTDQELNRVGSPEEDVNLVVEIGEGVKLSPWIEENLAGLVAQCRSTAAVSLEKADQALADSVHALLGPIPEAEAERPVLAGNSVHGDWYLARKFLPKFSNLLHYRHLDVSSLKVEWQNHFKGEEFDKADAGNVRKYFPDCGVALETQPHDAHYDVIASAAELGYYRSRLQVAG